ncbi:MAG TPA: hypothetical protein VE685_10440 [Thermoanaerobaculia bacterium]|nr:hypothetical protein [Thermoanaerobaculia bacterium]
MIAVLVLWLPLLLSVSVSAVGIGSRSSRLLLLGAALSLPVSLYLAATPRFWLTGLLLPLCHVAGALAVRREHRWMAGLSLALFAGFFGWLWVDLAPRDPRGPLPPGPTVTSGDLFIPVVRNAHRWENGTSAENLSAPLLIEAKRLTPTPVPPGALLRFDFPVPPRSVTVSRWEGDRPERVRLMRDDRLQVPDHPGIYPYSIAARWRQGSGGYLFLIRVR